MEKILVKTGIYSFIGSFFLLIIFMKREQNTIDVDGMTTFTVTPYPEYFFSILRYSVISAVIAVVLVCGYILTNKKSSE
ncbi:hypothetical protein [Robertmurraya sp. FSL R5-0851]|uniref:hypothetical protein n=1 Tax=Robertmurraya sp. FSL R5-0851 TaxID=2921584 RepID=UPI00136A38BB